MVICICLLKKLISRRFFNVKVAMKGLLESFISSPFIAKMKYGAYEVCKLQHSLALRRFLPLLPFSINIDGQASLIWKLFTARITH